MTWAVGVHGIVFGAWLVLFLAQALASRIRQDAAANSSTVEMNCSLLFSRTCIERTLSQRKDRI